jgi:signal transduction histidine kinase
VTIEVLDDGDEGVPAPATAGGRGLVGMTERVAALRGTLRAGRCEQGFRVHARLPRVAP